MCTETPILRFSVMLFGYVRVSSSDERQVVDLQLDALLAAGVDERHLHQDTQSGGRDDRAGLKACLTVVRAGDVLVVWKLDRLGRSLSHLVRILDDLKGRGVAFRSLTEGIDTTTSCGEFLYNLFGTPAQYERSLIGERVNAGLAAACLALAQQRGVRRRLRQISGRPHGPCSQGRARGKRNVASIFPQREMFRAVLKIGLAPSLNGRFRPARARHRL